ncbi:hypothetical protein HPB52_013112 [Rhipicephalus sanguineus]|uniref:Amino acid transporter n=1 Tax=Rhipicephalus sanguineus TaxID=34632 RepID=A0A9D4YPF9_RHISA|nr:hypothetical protein HPB52_013112 [Rhipicephalus sanguineus]
MGEDEGRVKLKKEIGLFSGVMIVVGTIIGSGIFVSPKGVFEHAGSVGASLVIWVLCGLFSMIGAVCYAELGTSIPRSGGDYAYVLEAFGPLTAFLRLWVTVLVVQPATLAVLSLTFATYMVKPLYPDCEPPDLALRLMAIVCLYAIESHGTPKKNVAVISSPLRRCMRERFGHSKVLDSCSFDGEAGMIQCH